jgi:hypothetical protein
MALEVQDRHRDGREEQMQVQDGILLASAVIWVLDRPSAFAWMLTYAFIITNIVVLNAALIACSTSLQRPCALACRQTGRCS